jgi:hypothetical protein
MVTVPACGSRVIELVHLPVTDAESPGVPM